MVIYLQTCALNLPRSNFSSSFWVKIFSLPTFITAVLFFNVFLWSLFWRRRLSRCWRVTTRERRNEQERGEAFWLSANTPVKWWSPDPDGGTSFQLPGIRAGGRDLSHCTPGETCHLSQYSIAFKRGSPGYDLKLNSHVAHQIRSGLGRGLWRDVVSFNSVPHTSTIHQ